MAFAVICGCQERQRTVSAPMAETIVLRSDDGPLPVLPSDQVAMAPDMIASPAPSAEESSDFRTRSDVTVASADTSTDRDEGTRGLLGFFRRARPTAGRTEGNVATPEDMPAIRSMIPGEGGEERATVVLVDDPAIAVVTPAASTSLADGVDLSGNAATNLQPRAEDAGAERADFAHRGMFAFLRRKKTQAAVAETPAAIPASVDIVELAPPAPVAVVESAPPAPELLDDGHALQAPATKGAKETQTAKAAALSAPIPTPDPVTASSTVSATGDLMAAGDAFAKADPKDSGWRFWRRPAEERNTTERSFDKSAEPTEPIEQAEPTELAKPAEPADRAAGVASAEVLIAPRDISERRVPLEPDLDSSLPLSVAKASAPAPDPAPTAGEMVPALERFAAASITEAERTEPVHSESADAAVMQGLVPASMDPLATAEQPAREKVGAPELEDGGANSRSKVNLFNWMERLRRTQDEAIAEITPPVEAADFSAAPAAEEPADAAAVAEAAAEDARLTPGERTARDLANVTIRTTNLRKQADRAEARRHYDIGMQLYERYEFSAALDAFREALRLDPESPEILAKVLASESLLDQHSADSRAREMDTTTTRWKLYEEESRQEIENSLVKAERLAIQAKNLQAGRKANMNEMEQIGESLSETAEALRLIENVTSRIKASGALGGLSTTEARRRAEALYRELVLTRDSLTARREEIRRVDASKTALAEGTATDSTLELQIATLLEQVHAYLARNEFEKARDMATQILAMDANNPEAKRLHLLAQEKAHVRREAELSQSIEYSTQVWVKDVLEQAIMPSEYLNYPSDWEEIKTKRAQMLQGAHREEWEQRIIEKLENERITLDIDNQPLDSVIQYFRDHSNLNIVIDSDVDPKTPVPTFSVNQMTMSRALNWILELTNLNRQYRDEAIYISKEAKSDVVMQLYPVYDLTHEFRSYQGSSPGAAFTGDSEDDDEDDEEDEETFDLTEEIKLLVNPVQWTDPQASIHIWRDNLLVMAMPETHRQINEFLNKRRLANKQQVVIDGKFIEVTDDFVEQVGISWYDSADAASYGIGSNRVNGNKELVTGISVAPGVGATSFADAGGVRLNYAFSSSTPLANFEVNALLHAVRNTQMGSVLHNPRILVANGNRAYMQISTQTSYVGDYTVGDNNVFTPNIQQYDQGINFDVRPIISFDQKYVTVYLRPWIAMYDPENSTTRTLNIAAEVGDSLVANQLTIMLPVLKLTQLETWVTIPDSGTVLLGGLIKDNRTEDISGVPMLGSIPFFGRLLRSENRGRAKHNTIIMVTAKIIALDS